MLDGEMVPRQTWWYRLWSWGMPRPRRLAEPLPVAAVPGAGEDVSARTAADATDAAAASAGIDADACVLRWLLGAAPEAMTADGSAADAAADAALRRLDALLADPGAQARLLPRAAVVLPRLLASLRRDTGSVPELARLVMQDMALVAEVMRLANSSFYRRSVPVVQLQPAIQRLGVAGLRAAIARTVLKPMIVERGASVAPAVAERLWQHIDRHAQWASGLARRHGLDDFEAYLLGLVHAAAWSPVLRSLGHAAALPASADRWAALAQRRDCLFAAIARHARFSEALIETATEVASYGLHEAPSRAAGVLREASRQSAWHCLAAQSAPALPAPQLANGA